MSDPYYDAEASVDASYPVELYRIVSQQQVWYLTSAERDILWQGIVYSATGCDRSDLSINPVSASMILTVSIPANHAIPRRWAAFGGTPPYRVTVTVSRLQVDAGVAEQLWSGDITNITFKGQIANLAVPSKFISALSRKMGVVTAGRMCPHVLFDSKCRISPILYTVTTPAVFVSGQTVRVDIGDVAKKGNWSSLGDITHVASGEPMLIVEQNDISPTSTIVELTLHAGIYELKTGDMVTIRAGCFHDAQTCITKFDNMVNFGLFPNLPLTNPMLPTGLGVVEQT